MKKQVVVSRKWDNPNIEVSVCDIEIGIRISLDDFINALAIEVGNPTFVMTVNGLKSRLIEASVQVIEGMKIETAKVM